MSRDEILALPAGRELDQFVAEKVMGKHCGCADTGWGIDLCEVHGGADDDPYAPPYSTDIEAAWEVVASLQPHFGRVNVEWDMRNSANTAELWNCGIGVRYGAEASAATAPLAICRAALLTTLETLIPQG